VNNDAADPADSNQVIYGTDAPVLILSNRDGIGDAGRDHAS
jgi:hypothetical protein